MEEKRMYTVTVDGAEYAYPRGTPFRAIAADFQDRTPCGRVNLTEREACVRSCDFEGVENCMTETEAKQEASRCLRCDHFGYGIFKGGREKLW